MSAAIRRCGARGLTAIWDFTHRAMDARNTSGANGARRRAYRSIVATALTAIAWDPPLACTAMAGAATSEAATRAAAAIRRIMVGTRKIVISERVCAPNDRDPTSLDFINDR